MTAKAQQKRLNINLPKDTYGQLKEVADETHRSMTEVIRTGLQLVCIAIDEDKKDHSIAVVNSDDRVLKRLVIPR